MQPYIIKGDVFEDERGSLKCNNSFDSSEVKRWYITENSSTGFIRGWQGHKIEKRWFAAVTGSFRIVLVKIDDLKNPSRNLPQEHFDIDDEKLNILYCPPGYVSAIQATSENSRLLIMADYLLGVTNDDLRYSLEYFQIENI